MWVIFMCRNYKIISSNGYFVVLDEELEEMDTFLNLEDAKVYIGSRVIADKINNKNGFLK